MFFGGILSGDEFLGNVFWTDLVAPWTTATMDCGHDGLRPRWTTATMDYGHDGLRTTMIRVNVPGVYWASECAPQ